MKVIVLVFCAVAMVVAKEHVKDISIYNLTAAHSDNYIKRNRLQQSQLVQEFDKEMENFKKNYNGRIENLYEQLDMTVDSVVRMEEYLDPLELLDDVSSSCIVKYRNTVPNEDSVITKMRNCINLAVAEQTSLLAVPLTHRNTLFNYFKINFEGDIIKCGTTHAKGTGNYTTCITGVTSTANTNIVNYRKTFDVYMDTAECTAKAHIKKASDCTSNIASGISSQIAEAKVLINNCLLGKDECKPCPAVCPESRDLQVDYQNETMLNPFYKRQDNKGCLLLNIKN